MDRTPLRRRPARGDRALGRDPFRRRRTPARRRSPPKESARRLCQCHQLGEGARLVRKPVPRSINLKGIGTPPSRLAFLLGLALSSCTTSRPPQISYDDQVPPSPDLP